ncbi:MAG: DNA repair protein RadC [Acidobacteria bacterium]|nr:DNA repair protein RadC [Acidobacteriota bacterium]
MTHADLTPLPVPEGPREKLERLGMAVMSDAELLAIVLGHGTSGHSAHRLAVSLLEQAPGLHGLIRMSRDELCRLPGIGAAQAARVLAGIEVGRRTLTRRPASRPQFLTARETAEHLLPRYGAHHVERFGVLLLDTKQRLLRDHIISQGSLDTSLAHPREVFRAAVGSGAACVIVFHNHPSGDPFPSPDDYSLTQRLAKVGTLIGVPLVDHLILADGGTGRFESMG